MERLGHTDVDIMHQNYNWQLKHCGGIFQYFLILKIEPEVT